ncbi:MAG: TraR/DksA C4-type zinc finger protein [Patescibacteria group bacterium]
MEHLQKYQEILTKQLQDVTAQLQDLAILDEESQDWIIKTNDFDVTEADVNSQADNSEEADERIAIVAELENRYHLIQHALEKCKNGTYGICEIAGEPIELGRLEANPAARTCTQHMETEFDLPLP